MVYRATVGPQGAKNVHHTHTRCRRRFRRYDGRAWFDAGYLIESYRQGDHLRADKKSATWTTVNETIRVDGYGFVKKAIAMTGPSAEMELAASLMTHGGAWIAGGQESCEARLLR